MKKNYNGPVHIIWEKTNLGSANRVSSIQFGVEVAFQSLQSETPFTVSFRVYWGTKSIQINGLVWMGEAAFMKQQIEEKLAKDLLCKA
jgi:hypothetical protein